MTKLRIDLCARCGSDDISGPNSNRVKTGHHRPKYRPVMRFRCNSCDWGYEARVSREASHELRVRQAILMWNSTRFADLYYMGSRKPA